MTQILEDTLKHCRAKDLACLEVTCAYFLSSGVTEKMAKERLQEIPRAKGLIPRQGQVPHGISTSKLKK